MDSTTPTTNEPDAAVRALDRLVGTWQINGDATGAVTFGTDRIGETRYAHNLLADLRAGMIVLADRNFAARAWIIAVASTGADVLVRVKTSRVLPVCRRLADGSYVSRFGPLEVRVITAQITITTTAGRRSEVYRLITTIVDPRCPAGEIVGLYHERWEIETSFFELKSTTLSGRVLCARTPTGVDQEIYALLIAYQALRIAIADAVLARPDLDPDRGSFTIALNTARDQLTAAAGVIADTVIDLVGVIGRAVLAARSAAGPACRTSVAARTPDTAEPPVPAARRGTSVVLATEPSSLVRKIEPVFKDSGEPGERHLIPRLRSM